MTFIRVSEDYNKGRVHEGLLDANFVRDTVLRNAKKAAAELIEVPNLDYNEEVIKKIESLEGAELIAWSKDIIELFIALGFNTK